MSKTPRNDEITGADSPTIRQTESMVEELPARLVSNEKAQDVKGGANPRPLPPGGAWITPPELELPAIQFEW